MVHHGIEALHIGARIYVELSHPTLIRLCHSLDQRNMVRREEQVTSGRKVCIRVHILVDSSDEREGPLSGAEK